MDSKSDVRQVKVLAPEGASVQTLALREALVKDRGKTVTRFETGELKVEVRAIGDSVWALIRREDAGGLALRVAFLDTEFECEKQQPGPGEVCRVAVRSVLGDHCICFAIGDGPLERLRSTVRFTPAVPLLIPFQPRDLYPLGRGDDPIGAKGVVEATQRGMNSGLVYFRIDEPEFGNVLYFQNLTAMNPYYEATETTPDSAVGGEWPELGWLLPTPSQCGTPNTKPLTVGEEIVLSDAILVFRHEGPPHERESARHFLQLLGEAYAVLDLPRTEYRDWETRARHTLRDLDKAPEATIEHYGHRYIHPYTNAEYPDVMVQLSIVSAIHQWAKWTGDPEPLEAEFKAGLDKFYDPELKTLRRYLPNVGDDKNADAVDSWYLYHPMLNLGLLALDGDEDARRLLIKSVDYAIRAAHHFDYKWPVQFDVTDFSIITDVAEADGRGQTDVGGVYAWVMLQLFELTDDKTYLDEACAAIEAAIGLRFNINYQANLTAWGAAACMRLWRITNRPVYLEQSYVYLASFVHNCEIWDSRIKLARHFPNFLGATCLQDAPYMAIFECFDAFTAFERYLDDSGPDLEPGARLLVSEYCRYALDRAWFYYPDALPADAISPEQRETNGHVDRKLNFPLEDLYPTGELAGQVGQEIYGAGAAFIFATRAVHPIEGAPFDLYCDHFLRAMERTGDQSLTVTLDGGENCHAGLSVVRRKRRKLTRTRVATIGGDPLRAVAMTDDRIDFRVPASGRIVLSWE